MALTPKVKTAIVRDNMETQFQEIDKLSRIRLSCLDDVAHIAEDFLLSSLQNGNSLDHALSLLGEQCREEESVYVNKHQFPCLALNDQYSFASLLTKRLLLTCHGFSEAVLPRAVCGGRVALVRSKATEDVFRGAKGLFGLREVLYVTDFKEATIAVAEGDADTCLLPYAENGFLPIFGIFDATMKADLTLFALLQTKDVSYGLYGKGIFSLPEQNVVLQFAVPTEKSGEDKLSFRINDFLTQRFSYRQGTRYLKIDTLQIDCKETLLSTLLYFRLFYPDIKITGCASVAQL